MTPLIDAHPSAQEGTIESEVMASLQANRIDPKLLYVTPRQAELWREVFLRHSPIHGNPEFARIYRDAFLRITETLPPGKIWLVGLGCGTGLKESALCSQLKLKEHEVLFSAVDVSSGLVAESAQKLIVAGALHHRSLVCDLGHTDFLAEWLAGETDEIPRLFTFFGLVPNLAPSTVAKLFHAILRPGDTLLASAHLAPIGYPKDIPAAMHSVLPQYDNPETLVWLSVSLAEWGLQNHLEKPGMTIGEIEGVPAFVAYARWKSSESFEKGGHLFSPHPDKPLQLFHSLRYTPELFEEFLRNAGLHSERLSMTACCEEAIWAIRK